MTALVRQSQAVLADRARSFRWAAAFLPRDARDDAAILYAFCRLVDDLADDTPDPDEAREALDRLTAEVRGAAPARPLVAEMVARVEARGGTVGPALELIRGVRGDLDPVRLEEDGDLVRYAWRVAGTVGLLMCPVLGVTSRAATPYAVDLGIAMQITNICRDVAEDAALGRVYLPARRLQDAGVAPETLVAGQADRRRVSRVVLDLLDLADRYYESAEAGMAYLPLRPRAAILVAGRVYRGIGAVLRRRGGDALAGRAVLPWPGKVRRVAGALLVAPLLAPPPKIDHDGTLHAPLQDLWP